MEYWKSMESSYAADFAAGKFGYASLVSRGSSSSSAGIPPKRQAKQEPTVEKEKETV